MARAYKKSRVIVLVGPTAVGKSALAVRLTRLFEGEVISADSRQVYKGLDIGTGKVTRKEMGGVPHHLLDVADPRRQFSVAEYQKLAKQKIVEILSRGNLPIICGGTGLYVDSALKGTQFPEVSPDWRLRRRLETKPAVELFTILKALDRRRAQTIDRHNPRRLIRAIEIALALGKVPMQLPTTNYQPPIQIFYIGLTLPPAELKRKISIRLFARIRKYKMMDEVRRLHANGLSWKRMEELGLEYRYVSHCLRGFLTKTEMLEKLQTEIWRYAKRQMVWFKRNKEIKWFRPTEKRAIAKVVREFLRK